MNESFTNDTSLLSNNFAHAHLNASLKLGFQKSLQGFKRLERMDFNWKLATSKVSFFTEIVLNI